jgi:mono/diheme cytochrome c family protein
LTRVTENLRPAGRRNGAAAAAPQRSLAAAVLALTALAGFGGGIGCDSPLDDLNMQNTPRYEPGEASDFFADGRADRNQVPGTVAQGQLVSDQNRLLRTGLQAGKPSAAYPFEITKSDLERGKQRYDIYCAVCHNATGDGGGMIVKRGFVPPPSLVLGVPPQSNPVLDQRTRDLQNAPPGHFFQVISNGWGAMYSYNDRIPVEDRWRIAAYVKVLQMSQNADVATLPADVQEAVKNADKQPAGPTTPAGHGTAPAGHGAGHE